jgi:DNA polymerase III subunit epsilon
MSVKAFVEMLRTTWYVVLDTETTGLYDGEIVQIAIADYTGKVLLDTLVKPVKGIPAEATRIHGITHEMVKDAPGWGEVCPQVESILKGRMVVVYNAVYDRKMMHYSSDYAGLPKTDWKQFSQWWCAMEAFAEVYGEWNSYHQNYRWQTLSTAARYYGLPVSNAHTALGDVLMTLEVCRKMCGATG